MAVKSIPDEYRRVTPYLYLEGATAAIEFYKKALGATERMRIPGPEGTIGHAELEIGDSVIMMADRPERSPKRLGGACASFLVYVEDVDSVFKRALDAGATELQPVEDKFYGDRSGTITDPFGQEWSLATHIEDVSAEEMERRMAAMPAMT